MLGQSVCTERIYAQNVNTVSEGSEDTEADVCSANLADRVITMNHIWS
jgi:hypothetical protein